MEAIQGWVGSIATVTMIIATVAALCPKNSAGRAVAMCGCIIMTAVLVAPLRSFDESMLAEYTAQYEYTIEGKGERFAEENKNLRRDIIEESTRSYILQRAASLGISCDVQITCDGDIPYSAHIIAEDENKMRAVSKLIAAECGIPESRQTYKVEV